MTKKFIALFFAGLMLLSVSACGKDKSSDSSGGNATTTVKTTASVKIHNASEPEITMAWNVSSDETNAKYTYLKFNGWGTGEYTTAEGREGVFYWEMPEDGNITYRIKENGEWANHTWTVQVTTDELSLTDDNGTVKYKGELPEQYTNELCGVYKAENGAVLSFCSDGTGYFLTKDKIKTFMIWDTEEYILSFNLYTDTVSNVVWSENCYTYSLKGNTLTLTDRTTSDQSPATYTRISKIG